MASFGVIYFNHGQAHCARLLVSLYSLRRHYGGPATILDTGESGGVIERIAEDKRLDVGVKRIAFVARRRHSCYAMKSSLWRDSPHDETLLLDADTVVARPLEPLIGIISDRANSGFVVTRFADWVTTGNTIRKRIEQWRGVRGAAELVEASFEAPHPAVNTGVMGWRGDARETLEAWERITHDGWRCSFCDELGAQLILRGWPHTLVSSRFNSSPIYDRDQGAAVIHHCHGSKHVTRADGSGRGDQGHRVWWPVFREAWADNAGGVRDWVPAGDRHLASHLPLLV